MQVPAVRLTDIRIKEASPRERDWKLFDTGGLYLLIRPGGSRLWKMKFRFLGREQKLSFGAWPLVSLKEARARRDEARLELYRGNNPVRQKRDCRTAALLAAQNGFGDVAREYIAKREVEGLAPATIVKATWFLALLEPALGRRPVAEITPHELLGALRGIERHGRRETARRARAFASRVFRYAVATLRASGDPAQLLAGALIVPVSRHYAAITDPAKLGRLLCAIDYYDGLPVTRLALQLAPHVFLRPGELRGARWSEIDGDTWRLPAERMKARRAHAVPLSRQVKALLTELSGLRGRGDFVFPSPWAKGKPLSAGALNGALRRMGYGKDEITAHGLRATASTLLNESGMWSSDAIERALAHRDANAVRGAYHRGQHWDERVAMAQWWSDHLDTLRAGAAGPQPDVM